MRCRRSLPLALVALLGLSGCSTESASGAQEPGSDAASVAADVRDLELPADTQDFAIALAEGQEEGAAGGAEVGREVGYQDAEQGEERETNADSTPDLDSDFYDPALTDDTYDADYAEGFEEAWVEAYEEAYQAGYDEALEYYRDLEVENPDDEDCSDFGGAVVVSGDDPDNLDQDGDGVGCES